MPGFGSTPGFQGPPSVEQMADVAAGLLDELKVREPVVVGGLSMGGYVALAFAAARGPAAGTDPGRHAGRGRR